MRIGFRTVKTATGVCLSILIAQWLELPYYSSAGILTLLCIQRTRKQSIAAVMDRFFACIVGMFLSSAMFWLLGYKVWVILILYLIFIPILVRLKIQNGISSSSVIIMHGYMSGYVSLAFFAHELAIIMVGLGVALLVNLYMPGLDRKIDQFKTEVSVRMASIFRELGSYLREGNGSWDGKELLQLADLLKKARHLAVLETENNLTGKLNPFYYYVELKFQQFQIIERMVPLVSRIGLRLEQGERIGEFLGQLGDNIEQLDDSREYLQQLKAIREYHKGLPMPQNRTEFESRASLFTLANELENFLLSSEKRTFASMQPDFSPGKYRT
ncbi:aromatic acid exporter family protein [Paenibacillus sp. GCM10012307]|uniref:Aromatic acid exporter family protein n=1 Tax=Paenibacillus roseus TaxID=2798579 RepID=A0A934J703_9BACL|nr:aromatic acid exporter family protein [Paenibacillus roseus]MBJ6361453.1 aromatic acid exporter family protein [Paenibacillus roseus]